MEALIDAVRDAVVQDLFQHEKWGWTTTFCFPEQFVGFSGHFPDAPVLPAIVQVLAAQVVAESVRKKPLRLFSVTRAKFHVQIGPKDRVHVCCKNVRADASEEAVEAKIIVDDQVAASFFLHFTNEEEK